MPTINGTLIIDINNTLCTPKSPQGRGLVGMLDETDHWMCYGNGQANNLFDYSEAG